MKINDHTTTRSFIRSYGSPADVLEDIVDTVGLEQVLIALGEMCGQKANHLRENWGGTGSGRAAHKWDQAAMLLLNASERASVKAVSPQPRKENGR